MGLFNILDPALDFILNPLIDMGYIPALVVLAFVFTFALTFLQKKVTDQELLKRIKEEMKELQNEMKLLKDNPGRMREIQSQIAATNMKAFKQSIKPSLYTIIPFIVIFGWLNANISYLPLMPGDEFTVTLTTVEDEVARIIAPRGMTLLTNETQKTVDETVTWGLKAEREGRFTLEFEVDKGIVSKEVTVTTGKRDGSPVKAARTVFDYVYSPSKEHLTAQELENVRMISVSNKQVKPYGDVGFLPNWMEGWIATYIVLSLVFNIILRKVMKVY